MTRTRILVVLVILDVLAAALIIYCGPAAPPTPWYRWATEGY